MKVVFAGTPEFARSALQGLCEAGFDVALVLTQPDRPAGRGMKMHESPVKVFARERGIAVSQPRSLKLDGRVAARRRHARGDFVAQAQQTPAGHPDCHSSGPFASTGKTPTQAASFFTPTILNFLNVRALNGSDHWALNSSG